MKVQLPPGTKVSKGRTFAATRLADAPAALVVALANDRVWLAPLAEEGPPFSLPSFPDDGEAVDVPATSIVAFWPGLYCWFSVANLLLEFGGLIKLPLHNGGSAESVYWFPGFPSMCGRCGSAGILLPCLTPSSSLWARTPS